MRFKVLFEQEIEVEIVEGLTAKEFTSLRDTDVSRYDEILDKVFSRADFLVDSDEGCMTFLDVED